MKITKIFFYHLMLLWNLLLLSKSNNVSANKYFYFDKNDLKIFFLEITLWYVNSFIAKKNFYCFFPDNIVCIPHRTWIISFIEVLLKETFRTLRWMLSKNIYNRIIWNYPGDQFLLFFTSDCFNTLRGRLQILFPPYTEKSKTFIRRLKWVPFLDKYF